ncbi:squalene synthase HpnC [Tautonia sp. JC769]|uniref:squalene synthase HpnC n=1 Tax=Tautonia sp. JC769 TaxID=3232135 RepID=UPI0034585429
MPSFADDLRRFGPDAPARVSRDEALAYCAALTKSHYENFSVVTWLTPPHLVPAFQAIYAFCRWSDDLGDEVGDRARSTELLSWWRDELRQMDAGTPRHPVMIALRDVVRQYAIPLDPFEALISAFEQDQIITDYDSYEQLLDYCSRSANPVGHLILYLGRVHTPEHVRLSDATCTALQLANFWQDVSRDLDIGRVYLPLEDRERFGYPDDDLFARRFTPAFARLLAFEVGRTRELFRLGAPLADALPGRLAVDIDLFTRSGLAILDRIEAQGFDVFRRRPTVGKGAKLGLLLRALLARSLRPGKPRTTAPPHRIPAHRADAVSGARPPADRSEARP